MALPDLLDWSLTSGPLPVVLVLPGRAGGRLADPRARRRPPRADRGRVAADVLAHHRFPQLYGVLVAGTDDPDYAPQQRTVRAACVSAGVTVSWVELPGGHSWAVWGPGLAIGLDRISGRLGLERE